MDQVRHIRLSMLPAHDCSYLPGREARMRGFVTLRMPGQMYGELLDAGFRRSGVLVYQPACVGCGECRSLRIRVNAFVRTESQKRCWRRNADLNVRVSSARATDEKFELYARYMRERHGREQDATREAFTEFLYESPVETLEMEYRDGRGKLVGVGICDRVDRGLSSVYFYFDPDEGRRSLGTFAALWEIEFARGEGLQFYYLGYWVKECASMTYKSAFGPHELLGEDGVWRAVNGGTRG